MKVEQAIESFVDRIYRNVQGDIDEVRELKEEMKTHLLHLVEEGQAQGKTEDEAVLYAIEQFGGEEDTTKVVAQLFTYRRRFANRLYYAAFAVLLLSLLLFVLITAMTEHEIDKLQAFRNEILHEKLANQTEISDEVRAEIVAETKELALVNRVEILKVYVNEKNKKVEESALLVEKSVFGAGLPLVSHTGGTDGSSFKVEKGQIIIVKPWSVSYEFNGFAAYTKILLICGICIYWLMYAIWACLQARGEGRFHILWAIIFLLFNVLGYGLYRMYSFIVKVKLQYE